MNDLSNIDLSAAPEYVKKATVLAFHNAGPATYDKQGSWGANQDFPGAHWTIVGSITMGDDYQGGRLIKTTDVYGCAEDEFATTYEAAEGLNEYRKSASIRAEQQSEPFVITTTTGDGNVEADKAQGAPGDWAVVNPNGEKYHISAAAFAETYVEK